jgi:hypothetical protein
MIAIRAFQARPGDLLDGESAQELIRTETWRLVASSDPGLARDDEITLTDVDERTYTFGANEEIKVLRPVGAVTRI